MESSLSSSTEPSLRVSFHGKAERSSSPSSGAHLLNCKSWNNAGKQKMAKPVISRRKTPSYQNIGFTSSRFVTRSWKESDYYLEKSASEHPLESDRNTPFKSFLRTLDIFYRFSRFYAFMGYASSIISVSLIAVEKFSDFSPMFFARMFEAIFATFLIHIYYGGLNQLTDIEIDKVNKPYLPLASGEYSIETAVIIILFSGIMGFWISWNVGSWPLFWALLGIFLFGTVYSINLPFMRWKNSGFLAALCLFAMRVPPQLAFYLHTQTFVLGRPALLPKSLLFATLFMSLFSVIIALFKDIHDVAGDKIHGVRSIAIWLGPDKVFWTCIALFQTAYIIAILVGLTCLRNWSKFITIAGHIILSFVLWNRTKSVDLESKATVLSFYMFIWRLLDVECLLIPLIR